MDFKWILITVSWCHLVSVTRSAPRDHPRDRVVRQAASTPAILKLITGGDSGVCYPTTDSHKCERLVFTADASEAAKLQMICNFVPTLFDDGSAGVERPDLTADTVGTVLATGEVPEVHCLPPSLPDNTFSSRSTAVQYQIRLRHKDGTDLTSAYTLALVNIPCVDKTDSGGQPAYNIRANHCVIDGTCVPEGEARNNNPAQTCVSADEKFSWTGPELTTTPEPVPTTEQETTEGKTTAVTTPEDKPTIAYTPESIQVTAAKADTTTETTAETTTETTTVKAQTPPASHVTAPATGGQNGSSAAYELDMVALLGSIIVLEVLLIIAVVMVIAYVKTKNTK